MRAMIRGLSVWLLVAAISSVVAAAQLVATTLVSSVPFIPAIYSAPSSRLRTHLVSSGGRLFWTDATNAPIKSLPAGGGPIQAHAVRMGAPHDVLVVDGAVVFLEQRDNVSLTCFGSGTAAVVTRAALDGSLPPTPLAVTSRCGAGGDVLATDGTRIFYVGTASAPPETTIFAVSPTGGTPETFHQESSVVYSMAADATHLYWSQLPLAPMAAPQIRRRPLSGGPAQGVVTLTGALSGEIAVTGDEVFYARFDGVQHTVEKVAASGGTPVVLAVAPGRPLSLAVDVGTGSVYWLDATAIHTVPLTGGAPVTVHSGLQSPVDLVTVAGQYLVWTENVCCPVNGRVMRVPIAGGAAVEIAAAPDAPRRMFVHGNDVIWAEGVPLAQRPIGAGRIARVAVGGGPTTTLAAGLAGDTFTPFAVDATSIYAADSDKVVRVPLNGGQPVLLYRGPDGPNGIVDLAVDGAELFFLEETTVRRLSTSGGAAVTVATHAGLHQPFAMLLDATRVYWADMAGVYAAPRAGGPAVALAQNLAAVNSIATDGLHVYFGEGDAGRVARVAVGGGAVEFVGTAGLFSRIPIAVSDTDVYWRDAAMQRIQRRAKGSGAELTLATDVRMGVSVTDSLIIDGAGVAWTEVASRRIRRAAPPVPPTLTIAVNRQNVGAGDIQALSVQLGPGTDASPVDVFLVDSAPDGTLRSLQADGTRAPGLRPIVRGLTPLPFSGEVWRGPLPPETLTGAHAWLGALTRPGTLDVIGAIARAPYTVHPPGAPTGLTAQVAARAVTLQWQAPAVGTPTSYLLDAGTGPGLANLLSGVDIGPGTTVTFASVPPGTYFVRLRTRTGTTASAPSNDVVIHVP